MIGGIYVFFKMFSFFLFSAILFVGCIGLNHTEKKQKDIAPASYVPFFRLTAQKDGSLVLAEGYEICTIKKAVNEEEILACLSSQKQMILFIATPVPDTFVKQLSSKFANITNFWIIRDFFCQISDKTLDAMAIFYCDENDNYYFNGRFIGRNFEKAMQESVRQLNFLSPEVLFAVPYGSTPCGQGGVTFRSIAPPELDVELKNVFLNKKIGLFALNLLNYDPFNIFLGTLY